MKAQSPPALILHLYSFHVYLQYKNNINIFNSQLINSHTQTSIMDRSTILLFITFVTLISHVKVRSLHIKNK